MKRTQIYISEEMQEKLDVLSRTQGSSRSEIISEAVTEYIARKSESEKRNKLKSGTGFADALIAATATTNSLTLINLNKEHFGMLEVLQVPYRK